MDHQLEYINSILDLLPGPRYISASFLAKRWKSLDYNDLKFTKPPDLKEGEMPYHILAEELAIQLQEQELSFIEKQLERFSYSEEYPLQ